MSTDFMRRYRVEHHTIYSYSEVVTLSHQQLHYPAGADPSARRHGYFRQSIYRDSHRVGA